MLCILLSDVHAPVSAADHVPCVARAVSASLPLIWSLTLLRLMTPNLLSHLVFDILPTHASVQCGRV